jgi:hypothetical protein
MSIFNYTQDEVLGTVDSVDTSTIIVRVDNDDNLRNLQVNHLVAVQSTKTNQHLIGLVSKIVRKSSFVEVDEDSNLSSNYNILKVVLIGTHIDKVGSEENVFRRTLSTVPTINAECYLISGDRLKEFMQKAISSVNEGADMVSLQIGNYSIDENAIAWLNGNKFFQRHSVIVGSTGSGKSWCVARILEQVAQLKSADAILFDIHGEYAPLVGDNFSHFKVAGPMDVQGENLLFLPYWLLTYEEMLSLMLDRSDSNAPNQATIDKDGTVIAIGHLPSAVIERGNNRNRPDSLQPPHITAHGLFVEANCFTQSLLRNGDFIVVVHKVKQHQIHQICGHRCFKLSRKPKFCVLIHNQNPFKFIWICLGRLPFGSRPCSLFLVFLADLQPDCRADYKYD